MVWCTPSITFQLFHTSPRPHTAPPRSNIHELSHKIDRYRQEEVILWLRFRFDKEMIEL